MSYLWLWERAACQAFQDAGIGGPYMRERIMVLDGLIASLSPEAYREADREAAAFDRRLHALKQQEMTV